MNDQHRDDTNEHDDDEKKQPVRVVRSIPDDKRRELIEYDTDDWMIEDRWGWGDQ